MGRVVLERNEKSRTNFTQPSGEVEGMGPHDLSGRPPNDWLLTCLGKGNGN